MKIVKDDRKQELYGMLKNLYFLAKKQDFGKYIKLKTTYNKLLTNIFGGNFSGDSEGFYWDNARNALDHFITTANFIEEYKKRGVLDKIISFEKKKEEFLKEAEVRIKMLEKYLK